MVAELEKFKDWAIASLRYSTVMAKFADSKLTVVQRWDSTQNKVYAGNGKQAFTAQGTGDIPSLLKDALPVEYAFYTSPPKRPEEVSYSSVDDSVEQFLKSPSSFLETAMDMMSQPTAGVITVTKFVRTVETSGGFKGTETRGRFSVHMRVWEKDRTGHFSYTGRRVSSQSVKDVLSKASEFASVDGEVDLPSGKYDVVMSPMVVGNLVSYLGWMSSAMSVELGSSVFVGKKEGERVMSEKFTLRDAPLSTEFGEVSFDDEGVAGNNKAIIERGTLNTLLYNSAIAKAKGRQSSGNAGWILPRYWYLSVDPGDVSEGQITDGNSVLFTNNWYTRLQNYVEGTFSTVGRDAIIVYRDGKPIGRAKGRLRITGDLPGLFSRTESLSREVYPIHWWEVENPVLVPYIRSKEVYLSKA